MKYGIVIPTLFNSEIFQHCLISLKESFPGKVVIVEEGNTKLLQCKDLADDLGFEYLKSEVWGGPDPLLQMGVKVLDDCDIVLYSHSDVIFSRSWFDDLNAAWQVAYPTEKIGMLNLSFTQPHSNHSLVVENDMFGFCVDIHQPHRVGRCSVTTSFRRDVFKRGLNLDIGTHCDTELCWNFTQKGQWSCWIANDPLTHMSNHKFGGNDITLSVQNHTINNYHQIFMNQQKIWLNKYKFDLDYYIDYEFLEVKYNYWDDIISNINRLNFSEIHDYLHEINDEMIIHWPEHRTVLKND